MNPNRRLAALEKKIGPSPQRGTYHVLVIEPGQDKKQKVADFKKANGIKSDDQLWIVEAVAPDRQEENTDELQQAD
jgi:precorrin-6B methylase 1